MAERRTRGFWKGFFTGLLLAAAGLLALAWFHPPQPLLPPEMDAGALEPPAAPGQRDGTTGPETAAATAAAGGMPVPVPAEPTFADLPAPAAPPEPAAGAGSPSTGPTTGQ